ncbi:hypothetical protein Tco_0542229 [Tanacetum coccineum]
MTANSIGASVLEESLENLQNLPTTTFKLHQTPVELIKIILQESTEALGQRMHKGTNNNKTHNVVFAMENEHPEQPESSNDIYLVEHGDTNITIDSLDICYDRDQDDQDDQSMIGSLMYLTASRPDIMFAVSACSRHQVTPLTSHLNAVKKIFKYLKGQPKLGLWFPKDSPFQLEAYSDSDYAGSHGDRKSTTGGCPFLGRRLISWQCKKQTIVATSSTEAEYVAAASCCAQVLWIQNQLLDYGFNFMNTKIFIDNQSTICIVKNPVFHQRTKHIEIRHHFIRDANEKNLIQVLKIHTDDNVADLLTKAFDGPRFEYLVVHIGMVDMVLVSAGSTVILLGVILPAGCLVSAGSTVILLGVILPAGCLVSAGSTMILLGVILPAGCFVSAGNYGLCCWFRVHAGRHTSPGGFISADRVFVYAVNTSFYAAELVCAGSIMFLLAELFLLVVTCLCCLNLVSAVLSLILLVGWSLPLVTQFLLVVSIPAGVSMYLLNE